MTPEERQELRDFLAREVMGAYIHPDFNAILVWPDGHETMRSDYKPDSPSSPASQILGVIEAMRKLRWWCFWNNEENVAKFYHMDSDRIERVRADNLLDAICLAAKAAVEGEK